MSTVLIPSKMSAYDANQMIAIERRVDNEFTIPEKIKDDKFFNIMIALLTIEIHCFIFNFMKAFMLNIIENMFLYGIGVFVIFIVILANYRGRDKLGYRWHSIIVMGIMVFALFALMMFDLITLFTTGSII